MIVYYCFCFYDLKICVGQKSVFTYSVNLSFWFKHNHYQSNSSKSHEGKYTTICGGG